MTDGASMLSFDRFFTKRKRKSGGKAPQPKRGQNLSGRFFLE
jgi:hypothetical protein